MARPANRSAWASTFFTDKLAELRALVADRRPGPVAPFRIDKMDARHGPPR